MQKSKKMWLCRILQGLIIGGGAILPGISGGVLCVVFGIYQPMMEILAHPKKGLQKYYALFIPVLIGWALGFVLFAGIIIALFRLSQSITIMLFVGLILGTIPTLYKEANKMGKVKGAWIMFAVGFLALFSFLLWVQSDSLSLQIEPNRNWFAFCGILWGLSMVIPGLTSSSILISLGLFEPMTNGIVSGSLEVIVPMLLGMIVVIVCLSKLINFLFNRYYAYAYHLVLGIILASTLVIVPMHYPSVVDIFLSIVVALVGFVLALKLEKLGM